MSAPRARLWSSLTGAGLVAALAACGSAPAAAGAVELPVARAAFRFTDLDGRQASVASLRGRVVAVVVVATWSDPALLELSRFALLVRRFGPELAILAIVVDKEPQMVEITRQAYPDSIRFVRVDFPQRFLSDSGPFGRITLTPTSVLLDRAGRIAARMDGVWPDGVLLKAVERLADQGGGD